MISSQEENDQVNLEMTNILEALSALATPGFNLIEDAEKALLSWEESDPNRLAVYLSTRILFLLPNDNVTATTTTPTIKNSNVPRLAGLLVLKAIINRKWNPPPTRGNLRGKSENNTICLSEEVKSQIQQSILSLVTTGGLIGDITIQNVELSNYLICDGALQVGIYIYIFKIFKLCENNNLGRIPFSLFDSIVF